MLANILDGVMNALSMSSLLANLMGVVLGIIFGALPGLTAAMGVALLIPLTFGMAPVEAFSALLGMYVGAAAASRPSSWVRPARCPRRPPCSKVRP